MSYFSKQKCKTIGNIGKASVFVSILVIPILLILSSCVKTKEEVLFDFTSHFWDAQTITSYRSRDLFQSWKESDRMFGWNKNRKLEQNAILIPRQKETAVYRFGCLEKKDTKLVIDVKSMLSTGLEPPPVFGVYLNGNKIFSSSITWMDYQRITMTAKKEFLHIGENYLEFHRTPLPFGGEDRHWLALHTLNFGRDGTPASSDQADEERHSFIDNEKHTIALDLNTCLSYHLKMSKGAKLDFDFSLEKDQTNSLENTKLLVYLETIYGDSHVLYEQSFAKKTKIKKDTLPIDLSPHESQILRISFVFVDKSLVVDSSTKIILKKPRIFKERVSSSPDLEQSKTDFPKSFNMLIYLVDCLRPDHLPFFDYEKNIAPHMTAFSKDCVLFRNAYAQSSWTRPSIGALFTGLYPFQHQAITLKSGLAAEFQTLAELLQDAGFHTIGISSNAGIKEFFNFNQGFTFFKYHSNLDGGLAETLNTYAFSQLQAKPSPFFLYLHTMEPHRPYKIKDEFLPTTRINPQIVAVEKKGEERYRVDLNSAVSMYDASITQNDKAFGDLMAELKRLGLYDTTLIILMSDHGEEFYEHGGFAHGQTLYQEQIKHLFIVKLPQQLNAGQTIKENVQEIDIFPTLLDLAGESIPAFLSGKSLKRLLLSPDSVDLPIHQEIFLETGPGLNKKAIIDGNWKLIHTGLKWTDEIREYELYALEVDPKEKTNLFGRNPIAARYLKNRLFNWVNAQEKLVDIGKEDIEKVLTPKEIEELKALGYIK
jgi:arylsulfatase A-like enzyme